MTARNGKAVELRVPAINEWDESYRALIVQTVLKPKSREATGPELAMFAEQVQRTGLDPFFGQIYGIYRKDDGVEKMGIQVGIDGFRLIAERTGKYQGQTPVEWCDHEGVWTDVWLKEGNPSAARVGVYKRGHKEPTYAVAHWREYLPSGNAGPLWRKMPANQIAKCAEALALRKVFPNELSGLYTPEEMDQADTPAVFTPEQAASIIDGTATEVKELPAARVDELVQLIGLAKSEARWKTERVKLAFSSVGAEVEDLRSVKKAVQALSPDQAAKLEEALRPAVDTAINARAAEEGAKA